MDSSCGTEHLADRDKRAAAATAKSSTYAANLVLHAANLGSPSTSRENTPNTVHSAGAPASPFSLQTSGPSGSPNGHGRSLLSAPSQRPPRRTVSFRPKDSVTKSETKTRGLFLPLPDTQYAKGSTDARACLAHGPSRSGESRRAQDILIGSLNIASALDESPNRETVAGSRTGAFRPASASPAGSFGSHRVLDETVKTGAKAWGGSSHVAGTSGAPNLTTADTTSMASSANRGREGIDRGRKDGRPPPGSQMNDSDKRRGTETGNNEKGRKEGGEKMEAQQFLETTVRHMRYRSFTRWYHGSFAGGTSLLKIQLNYLSTCFLFFVSRSIVCHGPGGNASGSGGEASGSVNAVVRRMAPATSKPFTSALIAAVVLSAFFLIFALLSSQVYRVAKPSLYISRLFFIFLIGLVVSSLFTDWACLPSFRETIGYRDNGDLNPYTNVTSRISGDASDTPWLDWFALIFASIQTLLLLIALSIDFFGLLVAKWYLFRSSLFLRKWGVVLLDRGRPIHDKYGGGYSRVCLRCCPLACWRRPSLTRGLSRSLSRSFSRGMSRGFSRSFSRSVSLAPGKRGNGTQPWNSFKRWWRRCVKFGRKLIRGVRSIFHHIGRSLGISRRNLFDTVFAPQEIFLPRTAADLSRPCGYCALYTGDVDEDFRPHGAGRWEQGWGFGFGETLNGTWEFGRPVPPFYSRQNVCGSGFTALRFGWVRFDFTTKDSSSHVYDAKPIGRYDEALEPENFEYGLIDVECSTFGKFFRKFPKYVYWKAPLRGIEAVLDETDDYSKRSGSEDRDLASARSRSSGEALKSHGSRVDGELGGRDVPKRNGRISSGKSVRSGRNGRSHMSVATRKDARVNHRHEGKHVPLQSALEIDIGQINRTSNQGSSSLEAHGSDDEDSHNATGRSTPSSTTRLLGMTNRLSSFSYLKVENARARGTRLPSPRGSRKSSTTADPAKVSNSSRTSKLPRDSPRGVRASQGPRADDFVTVPENRDIDGSDWSGVPPSSGNLEESRSWRDRLGALWRQKSSLRSSGSPTNSRARQPSDASDSLASSSAASSSSSSPTSRPSTATATGTGTGTGTGSGSRLRAPVATQALQKSPAGRRRRTTFFAEAMAGLSTATAFVRPLDGHEKRVGADVLENSASTSYSGSGSDTSSDIAENLSEMAEAYHSGEALSELELAPKPVQDGERSQGLEPEPQRSRSREMSEEEQRMSRVDEVSEQLEKKEFENKKIELSRTASSAIAEKRSSNSTSEFFGRATPALVTSACVAGLSWIMDNVLPAHMPISISEELAGKEIKIILDPEKGLIPFGWVRLRDRRPVSQKRSQKKRHSGLAARRPSPLLPLSLICEQPQSPALSRTPLPESSESSEITGMEKTENLMILKNLKNPKNQGQDPNSVPSTAAWGGGDFTASLNLTAVQVDARPAQGDSLITESQRRAFASNDERECTGMDTHRRSLHHTGSGLEFGPSPRPGLMGLHMNDARLSDCVSPTDCLWSPTATAALEEKDWRLQIAGWKQLEHRSDFEKMDALVFIHGYKTPLNDVPVLLGQMLALGGFPNRLKPIMFLWPAGTAVWHYYQARRACEHYLALRALVALFKSLVARGFANVHILVHSMGSRFFMNALPYILEENIFAYSAGHSSDTPMEDTRPQQTTSNHAGDSTTSPDEQMKAPHGTESRRKGHGKKTKRKHPAQLILRNLVFLHGEYYLDDFVKPDGGFDKVRNVARHITIYCHSKDEALRSAEILSRGIKCMGKWPFGFVRPVSDLGRFKFVPVEARVSISHHHRGHYDPHDAFSGLADGRKHMDSTTRPADSARAIANTYGGDGDRGDRDEGGDRGGEMFGSGNRGEAIACEWLDLDVIDCTYLDVNVHTLRHCFFNINASVIQDIRELLVDCNRARDRHAALERRSGNVYTFRTPPAQLVSVFGI